VRDRASFPQLGVALTARQCFEQFDEVTQWISWLHIALVSGLRPAVFGSFEASPRQARLTT
jgi:hypothetical protein